MSIDYRFIGEVAAVRQLITETYPTGVVSLVSDTFDFFKMISEGAKILKPHIMARQPNEIGLNKVVFRPDSGDPETIICGHQIENFDNVHGVQDPTHLSEWMLDVLTDRVVDDTPHGECGVDSIDGLYEFQGKFYKVVVRLEWNRFDKQYYFIEDSWVESCEEITPTPEQLGAVRCLWNEFGGTYTDTNHKMLDEHVGLIYGDSITLERAEAILSRLHDMGFASGNVVFGIGSYTYQYLTRDTFGFAMKATYGRVGDEERELFKDPVTDSGVKKSAKGLLRVEREGDDFVLYDQQTLEQEKQGELREIFRDGKLLVDENFSTICGRLAESL